MVRVLTSERILMTGITGIHGWPIYRNLRSLLPTDRLLGIGPPKMRKPKGDCIRAFCITDHSRLEQIRDSFRPTLIVHAAGVCDLDVCELRPLWADRINREGTAVIAQVFGPVAPIFYLSTDLVFSGNNPPEGGYAEHHIPDPVSVAGKTFAAGEDELLRYADSTIIRIGLPMGMSVTGDKGGLDWIEGRFKKGRPVTLFTDEYRSVISCDDLARCIIELICYGVTGILHCGGPEPLSLHSLGRMIIHGGGYDPKLLHGILRKEERNGPPRIGDVSLNSRKVTHYLSAPPRGWCYTANIESVE